MRRAAKRDLSEPAIVEALEAIGAKVYRDLPVDLLIHRAAWGKGWYRCLEIKTPGMSEHKKDRKRQIEFIADTGCEMAKTPTQAVEMIGRIA